MAKENMGVRGFLFLFLFFWERKGESKPRRESKPRIWLAKAWGGLAPLYYIFPPISFNVLII